MLGTGLGTFRRMYPQYSRSGHATIATHAENEYVQLLGEAGVVGLVLAQRSPPTSCRAAVAVRRRPDLHGGGGAGVRADRDPDPQRERLRPAHAANACLTAVTCGLIVSVARYKPGGGFMTARKAADVDDVDEGEGEGEADDEGVAPATPAAPRRRPQRGAGIAVAGGLAASTLLVLPGANDVRRADAAWVNVEPLADRLRDRNWQGDDEEYATVLAALARAVEILPSSPGYRYELNAIRWRSISRERDPATGRILLAPQAPEFVERIVSELNTARLLCPIYAPAVVLVGELEATVLGKDEGVALMRLGYRLDPQDPPVAAALAEAEADAGRWEASLALYRQAVALDGRLLARAERFYLKEATRPDLAVAVAENDADALLRLEAALRETPGGADLASRARARAYQVLKSNAETLPEPGGVLARLAQLSREDGDHAAAVRYYRGALAYHLGHIEWRLDLAKSLVATKQLAEASKELQTIRRLSPYNTEAEQMTARIDAELATKAAATNPWTQPGTTRPAGQTATSPSTGRTTRPTTTSAAPSEARPSTRRAVVPPPPPPETQTGSGRSTFGFRKAPATAPTTRPTTKSAPPAKSAAESSN